MTTNFPKPLDKQVAAISDSLSQTQDGLAIVANGNTHAAISSGQFVYVKGHDTLPEGLYKATSAIAANGTLSTSNLTPDGSGGLNDLQGQLTTLNSNLKGADTITVTAGSKFTIESKAYKLGHLCFVGIKATATDNFYTDVIATVGSNGLPTSTVYSVFTIRIRGTASDFTSGYVRIAPNGTIIQNYTGNGQTGDIYYALLVYNTIA